MEMGMGMGMRMFITMGMIVVCLITTSFSQDSVLPACAMDFVSCMKSPAVSCCNSLSQLVPNQVCFCQVVDYIGPVNAFGLNQQLFACGIHTTIASVCGAEAPQSTSGMSPCQIKLKTNCQDINPADTQTVCCPVMEDVVTNDAKCFCDLMTLLSADDDAVSRGLASCNIPGSLTTICKPGAAPMESPASYSPPMDSPAPSSPSSDPPMSSPTPSVSPTSAPPMYSPAPSSLSSDPTMGSPTPYSAPPMDSPTPSST